MMKTRQGIEKKYLTIAMGHMKDATLSGYVKKNEDEGKMYLVKKDTPGALSMKTIVHVLKKCSTCSLVEVQLITGRTHQIRVHMASIGHPLLGDALYGPAKCPYQLQGQTLHAYVLGFIHPSTGEYMEFQAPLPDYFEDLLKKLRQSSAG